MTHSRSKEPDGLLAWLLRIRAAPLRVTDKSVCFTIVTYIDWRSGAECFASVETIAAGAGLKIRATRSALRRLRAAGVVVFHTESKGGFACGHGLTHRIGLSAERLSTLSPNPAFPAGLPPVSSPVAEPAETPANPASADTEPGAGRHSTRQGTPANPAQDAGKHSHEPSIHRPEKQPLKETPVLHSEQWMDGGTESPAPTAGGGGEADRPSLRAMLEGLGIRGHRLEQLATQAGLTVEEVSAEWKSIESDPAVRNKPAVLSKRLGERFALPKRTKLGADAMRGIGQIESLRRQRVTNRE